MYTVHKSGKFHCKNIFVVGRSYEIKMYAHASVWNGVVPTKHENFSNESFITQKFLDLWYQWKFPDLR